MTKYRTTLQTTDSEGMMLIPTWVSRRKLLPFVIAECLAISRKTILCGKSLTWQTNTPKLKSSKTSAVDSTISVKGLKPYWDVQSEVNQSNLWLPTETDSQDLALNSLHRLSSQAVDRSWFSSRLIYPQNRSLQPTFSTSCMSSHAECTDSEIIKSKSVKLSITPSQRKTFNYWIDVSRFVFNCTIEFLKSYEGKIPSWMDIKKMFTRLLPEWTKKCPFQIKGMAIKDAHVAFWAGKGRPKFRSRKEPTQSCFIPKTAIKANGLYVTVSGKGLRYRESLPETPLDSRLVKQYGEWFLSVPRKVKTSVAENQGRIVALDPGVRTFQTFYSETSAGWLGYDDFGRIQRLCFYLDGLISRTTKAKNSKKKRSMKKAQNRMRKKIKNLVKELHNKTARFLVDNFDVILLPTFETQQMVGKRNRVLRSKAVRAMLTWSHYQFKMHLKNKALEFGKQVIDVCEAYTSKTVSWTGELKNVGGSRVIRSSDTVMDRDMNGARGIFVRALGDSPALMKMMGAC